MLEIGASFLVGRFFWFALEQVPGAAGLARLDLEQVVDQGSHLGIKLVGKARKMDVVDLFPGLDGQSVEC